jgi:hypothetical protein
VVWRKLHNEELHHLYSSPSIIRKIKSMEMDRVCSTMGTRTLLEVFCGKARKEEGSSRD